MSLCRENSCSYPGSPGISQLVSPSLGIDPTTTPRRHLSTSTGSTSDHRQTRRDPARRARITTLGRACSASLNRPVRTRMPWWCGESGQQWPLLPDFGVERLVASSVSNPQLAVSAVSNTITDSIIVRILTSARNTIAPTNEFTYSIMFRPFRKSDAALPNGHTHRSPGQSGAPPWVTKTTRERMP